METMTIRVGKRTPVDVDPSDAAGRGGDVNFWWGSVFLVDEFLVEELGNSDPSLIHLWLYLW